MLRYGQAFACSSSCSCAATQPLHSSKCIVPFSSRSKLGKQRALLMRLQAITSKDAARSFGATVTAADQQPAASVPEAQLTAHSSGRTAASSWRRQELAVLSVREQSSAATAAKPGPQLPVYYLAAAALAAGIVIWTYRTFITGAARHAASSSFEAVAHGLNQKKLQRQAASRLNDMSSLLQNNPTADLSAKSLGDEGTAYVVEALAFNTVCLAADFSNNGMGKLGIAQLSEVLPTCALQHLKLHTNNLGDEGAALLAQKLSGNGLLLSLDLGTNGIGDVGAAALAEGLKLNTTLQKLDLSGNAVDVAGAKALAEALAANTTLTSLTLSDNYISVEGAKALAEALMQNKSLTELSIKGNELGDEGIEALATALLAGKLVEFNMYMNEVGDAGMAKLAPAFKECKSLKNLDLGGNDAGPDGAAALAEALVSHPSLTLLELGYNPLGRQEQQPSQHDTKLEVLKLGWCKVGGGEGARALADLLMFNNSLVQGPAQCGVKKLAELDMGYNEIKDDGACALAQALKANPECAVRELKLNANYITRFGQVALTEAVDMVYEMGGGKMLSVTF
ncbi:hypothetical protein COO60DRAFT_1555123 [Scenedesmus sp. NREL 46B-D3]|nr:hypothetical protein COO60DRAFT_1555123 [Scenedesmus sp. NREL 46B-D3]